MKSLWKHAVVACSISVLAACGGGGGSAASIPVAADVGAITLNQAGSLVVAQTVAESGQPITFANGLPELGLTGSTTLTFLTNGTTFSATNGTNTVTGDVEFGTIRFTPRSKSAGFTGGPAIGTPTAFLAFVIDLNTAGVAANSSAASVPVVITIGSVSSVARTITIVISSNAAIQIGGQSVGNVTFTTTTGATGGS